jgi:hypothetical protein
MRQIATEFGVGDFFQDKGRWELRLQSKPLVRYESKRYGVVDGALFGYALGTVFEAGLLVEATDDGWQYALSRFSAYGLEGAQKGVKVWEVPSVVHAPLGLSAQIAVFKAPASSLFEALEKEEAKK